jgi:hypothetical protein
LDTVLSFESEVAQIFYTYLDLIMADKSSYERRTKELFDDLGLTGKAYSNRSNRKQVLERALRELQGAPLTTGRIIIAELEKTKDKKDYKVVIRKGPRHAPIQELDTPDADRGERVPAERLQGKEEITTHAEELVRYFYRVFHGVEATHPVSPAVPQAITLIAQHGLEKAKYVVDFAHVAAPQTNYTPQTFGGILHYTSRAVADFDRQKIEKARQDRTRLEAEHRERQERGRAQAQREADAKAQGYLDQLTPDERQKLYDQLVSEMRSKQSFLADWDGPGFDAFMRRAMLTRAREILAKQTDQT